MRARIDFEFTSALIIYMSDQPRSICDLKEEFSVSSRTIYRYIDNLHRSGFKMTKILGLKRPSYQIELVSTEMKNLIQTLNEKVH
jgi:predicted DNA-binding transcriptional regulator YafY